MFLLFFRSMRPALLARSTSLPAAAFTRLRYGVKDLSWFFLFGSRFGWIMLHSLFDWICQRSDLFSEHGFVFFCLRSVCFLADDISWSVDLFLRWNLIQIWLIWYGSHYLYLAFSSICQVEGADIFCLNWFVLCVIIFVMGYDVSIDWLPRLGFIVTEMNCSRLRRSGDK